MLIIIKEFFVEIDIVKVFVLVDVVAFDDVIVRVFAVFDDVVLVSVIVCLNCFCVESGDVVIVVIDLLCMVYLKLDL